MPHRDIREYDAKLLINTNLHRYLRSEWAPEDRVAQVTPETDWSLLSHGNPWLSSTRLVVKPDMLFGRRGKLGLIKLNVDFGEVQNWVKDTKGARKIDGVSGELTHFIVDPYLPHEKEYFVSIESLRDVDRIHFSFEGGMDIEEGWDTKVRSVDVPVCDKLPIKNRIAGLFEGAPESEAEKLLAYVGALYQLYIDAGLANLEINPFCIVDGRLVVLDVVASVDDAAPSARRKMWNWESFPEAFGSKRSDAEAYIRSLDEKTGASLKFTLLNPEGRIWLLVSGGGASVIFADTVSDLGMSKELANYGEYSGNPSTDETYEYAKTVLGLITANKHPKGKVLLIGGGIANFTDTAKTFDGIIKALKQYQQGLRDGNVKIFVRRAGPNYKKALQLIHKCGQEIGVPIEVHGPETHMTEIVKQGIAAL